MDPTIASLRVDNLPEDGYNYQGSAGRSAHLTTSSSSEIRQRRIPQQQQLTEYEATIQHDENPTVETDASPSSTDNRIDDKKNTGNYLFGFKPWKGMLGEQRMDESMRTEQVKQLRMWNNKDLTSVKKSRFLSVGNVLYTLLFGWWMFLSYIIVGMLCFMLIFTIPYGKKCFRLSVYFLYPFGKYLEVMPNYRQIYNSNLEVAHFGENLESVPTIMDEEQAPLIAGIVETSISSHNSGADDNLEGNYYSTPTRESPEEDNRTAPRNTTIQTSTTKIRKQPRDWTFLGVFSFCLWIICLAPILTVFHLITVVISWVSIFGIPTSKIHLEAIKILFRNILVLNVNDEYPPSVSAEIVLCTFQASNIYYYKHSVFGLNVILFNMLPFSFISILLGFAFGDEFVKEYALLIFPFCLISTIPLAYLIGKAVAAISAQTNFLIGAVLNAFCGSIIELILYGLALWKNMHDVVVTAITGAILAATLLVPVS